MILYFIISAYFFDFDLFRSCKFFDNFVLLSYVRQEDNLYQN